MTIYEICECEPDERNPDLIQLSTLSEELKMPKTRPQTLDAKICGLTFKILDVGRVTYLVAIVRLFLRKRVIQ